MIQHQNIKKNISINICRMLKIKIICNKYYFFSWSYILYKLLINDYSSTIEANLWQNIKWPVIIFQHAALLEVIDNF